MNFIYIFTDISSEKSSEIQKKCYKDLTSENSTFDEEGTCKLIKLFSQMCNKRGMECKCKSILNSNIFPFLYARGILDFVLKLILLVYTVEMMIHVKCKKVPNLKSSIKRKMTTRSPSKEKKMVLKLLTKFVKFKTRIFIVCNHLGCILPKILHKFYNVYILYIYTSYYE